jgi:glycosyltransferase involved in cell wall biosynthesis
LFCFVGQGARIDIVRQIIFIITGLSTGGAETMLHKLLSRIDRSRFKCRVISLTDYSDIGPKIEALGIQVDSLHLHKATDFVQGIFRLCKILSQNRDALVSTWMYHADFLGGIVAHTLKIKNIVWNIRNATLIGTGRLGLTSIVVKICANLSSRIPKAILTNSSVARDIHVNLGYDARKFRIIPNGFDLDNFRPNPDARSRLRKDLNFDPETLLIGKFARLDPQKNYSGFLEAFALVSKKIPHARALLIGEGVDIPGSIVDREIQRLCLSGRVVCLPSQSNIADFYATLDIFCLASVGEAFPNVLGEAMASGLCCVVSDAGDCRSIVGPAGIVVQRGNPHALAQGLLQAISQSPSDREALGKLARSRIQDHYTIESVTRTYEKLFNELIDEGLVCAA